ncbi:hypothetical protein [Saccharopolyspora elongata]|uniref:hypothetical protein n=1 Tax=Saccharopolyspora elongata TaxID=2530387 RepID=UPI001F16DBD5|nr:hypothetical protein [Saccharopolyspora elongata]
MAAKQATTARLPGVTAELHQPDHYIPTRDDLAGAANAVRGSLPSWEMTAFYGGLGALAAFAVIEWPVAVAIGVGAVIAQRSGRTAEKSRSGTARVEAEPSGRAKADELPISGYDSRTVGEITEQLPGLSQRELRLVEDYETRNRARTGILRRIDELRGEEPWAGYDEMGVGEILPRMRTMPADEQAAVADYEQHHKQRRTIIQAAHS